MNYSEKKNTELYFGFFIISNHRNIFFILFTLDSKLPLNPNGQLGLLIDEGDNIPSERERERVKVVKILASQV